MRVLLIKPDYPKSYRYGPKESIVFPPLGLEYVAGNILDIAEVRIFDNRILNFKSLRLEIEKFQPDYVGINCNYSTQIYHVNAIAKLAKDNNATTVLGGWHPSLTPNETLNSPWTDIIVRSEGELTFRELIQKNDPKGIDGLSYKKNSKNIHNSPRKLGDYNLILPPARNLRSSKVKPHYTFFDIPADSMETSRGCPFQCKFCSVHKFYSQKYRVRSVSNIMKELHEINKNVRFVYIIDDNFMVFPKHISSLCDTIIKEKLNMFFMSTARIDMVNKYPEIFEKMAKAGFFHLFVGIESFSNKALKNLHKRFKFKEIKSAIQILHNLGFIIQGNIIIGADFDDTEKDLESTIEIAKSIDLDIPTFSLLTPLPMTELRDEVIEKKMLLDGCNWHDYNWYTSTIKYPNLTSKQLEEYIIKAHSEVKFFTNPMERLKRIYKARGMLHYFPRIINYRFLKSMYKTSKNIITRILK